MACGVMAYLVMAYIAMAYIAMADVVMANTIAAMAMAYTVRVWIVMTLCNCGACGRRFLRDGRPHHNLALRRPARTVQGRQAQGAARNVPKAIQGGQAQGVVGLSGSG